MTAKIFYYASRPSYLVAGEGLEPPMPFGVCSIYKCVYLEVTVNSDYYY